MAESSRPTAGGRSGGDDGATASSALAGEPRCSQPSGDSAAQRARPERVGRDVAAGEGVLRREVVVGLGVEVGVGDHAVLLELRLHLLELRLHLHFAGAQPLLRLHALGTSAVISSSLRNQCSASRSASSSSSVVLRLSAGGRGRRRQDLPSELLQSLQFSVELQVQPSLGLEGRPLNLTLFGSDTLLCCLRERMALDVAEVRGERCQRDSAGSVRVVHSVGFTAHNAFSGRMTPSPLHGGSPRRRRNSRGLSRPCFRSHCAPRLQLLRRRGVARV